MKECEHCGNKFSRLDNLKRHQSTCQVQNKPDILLKRGVKRQYDTNCIIDKIINDNSNKEEDENAENNTIQSTSIGKLKEYRENTTKPVKEILSVQETAKDMDINVKSNGENSEDESIIHPSPIKRKRVENDDEPLLQIRNEHKDEDDNESLQNKNKDMDTDGIALEKGNENEEETKSETDSEDENISENELKLRLCRTLNSLQIFESDFNAERALSDEDILENVNVLKIPKFRGVFMIDELPKRINPVECGIVNLSVHKQLGTHWVLYAKIHKTRIYFDSFARKPPLEMQKYLKTAEEFRNNSPVIQRNKDIVQREDTKICGQLCLFVLTSLMRERFSFQQVMDQLNHAFLEYYY